ncbi:MAG: hypothetical protein WCF17_11350 [Terracidiphilus sp.]
MTIVNQGRVHASEGTGYATSVERNSERQWNFVWISFFEGNEMGRGCEGPFTDKGAAEAAQDEFVSREASKGNVVHSR